MKYFKYFFNMAKKRISSFFSAIFPILFVIFIYFFICIADGYTLEDFGFDGITLNPNDYCNLTDINYTAVLNDSDRTASIEITEYLTFDVHASSKSNPYRELWRELPEDEVDGMRVSYDVKSVTQILPNGDEIPYIETPHMYWEDEDYTQSATMRWHHSNGYGMYPDNDESLLIYIPWTYREKMTFKIVYTMNNAALKYNDCSELYISMFSGNTIKKLNSYKGQILIPNKMMPTSYYAYTFGTKNSRIPYTESNSINRGYHTFSIDLDKSDLKFDYHNRYIEFCLLSYGNDKHIFTKYAPDNLYSHENVLNECIAENEYYENQSETFKNIKTILLGSSILISTFIMITTIQKQKKIKAENKLYEPETDFEYFREIPSDLDPIFASELVFMKDPFDENQEKQEEYAAIVLSLVRKKYINLSKSNSSDDWSNYNTIISLEPLQTQQSISVFEDSPDYSPEPTYFTVNQNTGDILEPLTTSERLYFELLEKYSSKYNNRISISQLQNCINSDYTYKYSFIKDIEKKPALECGVMQGYFQKTDYNALKNETITKAKSSLTLSLILLIFVNLISYFTPMTLSYGAYTILGITLLWKYFYLTIKANDLILFTQFGKDEQAKWYGLYNFLNSDTLMNEKEVPDLVLWEKYLIYATAFGISEKVIKALKLHVTDLNIDNSPILYHHSYVHSSSFHRTSKSFGHSIHTYSRGGSHHSSFGGHGYGGGGRGGGGGGGGH